MRKLPILLALTSTLLAQNKDAKPQPTPDTVIFANGEQLTGTLEHADGKGITFKSLMAGEVNVSWGNIKELRSDKDFAVLTQKQKLTRKDATAVVPSGRITVADKQLVVATRTGPKAIPLDQADKIIDAAAFDKAVNHPPNLIQGWGGSVTGGASLVRATQNSTTFNGAVTLVRSTPTVDWLPARSRTNIDYNQSYGTVSQAGTPTILSNILHADAERDDYFSRRAFVFGSATFDHNFSELLALQQAYGVGVGITVLHNAHQQLDFKGDVQYLKQQFSTPTAAEVAAGATATPSVDQNLIGSTFSEKYLRYMLKGIVLNEFGSVSPAYNNTSAYSAHVNAGFTFPTYKNLAFNVNFVDDYLNNAPVGSNKNSTQYTTGLTYTIKPR